MTPRIRWDEVAEGSPPVIHGYAHLFTEPLFEIRPPAANHHGCWILTSKLPACGDLRLAADADAEDSASFLKDEAEEWLGAFLASIGAVWPDEPAPAPMAGEEE